MTIKNLTARSLTFFDDGRSAKLSIVTIEEGPMFIEIAPPMCALLNEELARFVAEQMRQQARAAGKG